MINNIFLPIIPISSFMLKKRNQLLYCVMIKNRIKLQKNKDLLTTPPQHNECIDNSDNG